MSKIINYLKTEKVFTISLILAILSVFFVTPDYEYLGYIDFRTLALLYSLMVVVSGINSSGFFKSMASRMCKSSRSTTDLSMGLILLTFFSSMLITNDVSLITFVPFTIMILSMVNMEKDLIWVIVLETLAANLGSMLTPIGNPQNLYLYSYYGYDIISFIEITLPYWILSFVIVMLLSIRVKREKIGKIVTENTKIDKRGLSINFILFMVCLLTVFRLIPWYVMLLIILVTLFFFNRKQLTEADFSLLFTFVFFFIFSGNLGRIEFIHNLISSVIEGKELIVSLLLSQVISNVPTALLLSGFTEVGRELILGVDIGGLGTPIASLASLISLKFYLRSNNSNGKKYIICFLVLNILVLIILILCNFVLGN